MSKKKEKNKKKKEKEAAGEDEGREEKVPPCLITQTLNTKQNPCQQMEALGQKEQTAESSEWPLPCPTWLMTLVQAAPYIPDF